MCLQFLECSLRAFLEAGPKFFTVDFGSLLTGLCLERSSVATAYGGSRGAENPGRNSKKSMYGFCDITSLSLAGVQKEIARYVISIPY
jgi:hypothetical protein